MFRKLALMLVLAAAALACSVGAPDPTPTLTPEPVPPPDTPVPPPPADTPIPLPTATPVPEGVYLLGVWEAIDIVDGSSMTLSFDLLPSGGMSFELYDDAATTCGGTPLYEFNSGGSVGFTGPNTFQITGTGVCDVTAETVDFAIDISYDAATDMLTESGGQTWTR